MSEQTLSEPNLSEAKLSMYSVADLLRLWARGDLTLEQAVGHLLQNLQLLSQRLLDVEKRLRTLEQGKSK